MPLRKPAPSAPPTPHTTKPADSQVLRKKNPPPSTIPKSPSRPFDFNDLTATAMSAQSLVDKTWAADESTREPTSPTMSDDASGSLVSSYRGWPTALKTPHTLTDSPHFDLPAMSTPPLNRDSDASAGNRFSQSSHSSTESTASSVLVSTPSTSNYPHPFFPTKEYHAPTTASCQETLQSVGVITEISKYMLLMRLPNFGRQNITIAAKRNRSLHIVADKYDEDGGHFERRISFGYDANMSSIAADYDGETLIVTVPRKERMWNVQTHFANGTDPNDDSLPAPDGDSPHPPDDSSSSGNLPPGSPFTDSSPSPSTSQASTSSSVSPPAQTFNYQRRFKAALDLADFKSLFAAKECNYQGTGRVLLEADETDERTPGFLRENEDRMLTEHAVSSCQNTLSQHASRCHSPMDCSPDHLYIAAEMATKVPSDGRALAHTQQRASPVCPTTEVTMALAKGMKLSSSPDESNFRGRNPIPSPLVGGDVVLQSSRCSSPQRSSSPPNTLTPSESSCSTDDHSSQHTPTNYKAVRRSSASGNHLRTQRGLSHSPTPGTRAHRPRSSSPSVLAERHVAKDWSYWSNRQQSITSPHAYSTSNSSSGQRFPSQPAPGVRERSRETGLGRSAFFWKRWA